MVSLDIMDINKLWALLRRRAQVKTAIMQCSTAEPLQTKHHFTPRCHTETKAAQVHPVCDNRRQLGISGSAFEFHILRQPRVSASSRSRTPPIKAAYTCEHVTLRLHVKASFWVRTRQRNRQVCLKSAIVTGRRFFPIFTRTFTKAVHACIMWPLGGTTTGKISSSSNISTCWRSHGSSTRSCICDLLSHN